MKDLVFQMVTLTKHNRDGSYATQANRSDMLTLCAEQWLEHDRYKKLTLHAIELEHITHLVERWKAEALSHHTIRNRLAALRWCCAKVNRAWVIPARNTAFGLEPRTGIATISKAQELPADIVDQISDPYVAMSLRLQRAFGLRREEAIKIRPHQADHETLLKLQGSWCKNGRPREVPIRTAAQRTVLDAAKVLAQPTSASLIPAHLKYVQQLHRYEYWCKKMGLNHMHGLRHAYAQERFKEESGFAVPVAGGPSRTTLTAEQAEADRQARMTVSRELGHGRLQITRAYMG